MLKYREVTGYFTARVPDSGDPDLNPDTIPLTGTVTFHPEYRKPLIFPGEHIVVEPISGIISEGHLMHEVVQGEDVVLQPLHLAVTMDEHANQTWAWRLRFSGVQLGEYGETVDLPDVRFVIEEGDEPLDLSTVPQTTARASSAFITRGVPGVGITGITASGGIVTVEWEGGEDVRIPIPTATLATRTNDGLMPRQTMAAVSSIEEGDPAAWRVLDESGALALGVTESGGVIAGGAAHHASEVPYRITDSTGRIALEVDATGRTHIYDPGFSVGIPKPLRTNAQAKFQPNQPQQTTYYPTFMDPRDRTTMINHNSSTLRYSRDEGETWHISHQFDAPVSSGVILDNGEVLVAIKTSGYAHHASLYLSKGWQENPAGAEWTLVHTFISAGAYPSAAFSWSTYRNIVIVSEYGPKLGQSGVTDAARHVYMSRDHGRTWRVVFDLLTDHPAMETDQNKHVHGVLYDPYWDRIWITHGDGNSDILFSDDLGITWHSLGLWNSTPYSYQSVGMIALPSCILIATDGSPNGVLRINRSEGKHSGTYPLDIAYLHDDVIGLTILCQSIWRAERPGDDAPVVFEFVSAPGAGRRFILTTSDGYEFNKVWEDPNVTRGNSSGSAYGPTASGRLLHYAVDEYFTPGGRTLRQGPMPSAY